MITIFQFDHKNCIVHYQVKISYISMYVLLSGCNSGKNKSGYNKLETDDVESDSEFYHKGIFTSISQIRIKGFAFVFGTKFC